MIHGQANIR